MKHTTGIFPFPLKPRHWKNILFLVFTTAVMLAAAYVDSIPDHSFQGGDFGLFVVLEVFPMMFFLHGFFSGIILHQEKKRSYAIITPLFLFIALFLIRSCVWDFPLEKSLKSALVGTLFWDVCSIAGMLFWMLIAYLCAILKYFRGLLKKQSSTYRP